MRVKICGLTSVADVLSAVSAGADAIGMNFVAGPRLITIETGAQILRSLPPFTVPVALVKLESGRLAPDLYEWLLDSPVRCLQVYAAGDGAGLGELSDAGFRVMPVVRVKGPGFVADSAGLVHGAAGAVLDAFDASQLGGTGKAFRWEWLAQARACGALQDWPPVILAGGLTCENVAEAIRLTQPYAVDVSSGVESAPGSKDAGKMREFVRAARSAEG